MKYHNPRRAAAAASNSWEGWSADELDLLKLWDGSADELATLAELLGRSEGACRQRHRRLVDGVGVCRDYHRRMATESVRVTRTTTTVECRYSQWPECDDYDPQWYR